MKKILVLGDSHTNVWEYIDENNFFPEVSFKVVKVSGASSQGIVNPNSKTNALPVFRKALETNQHEYVMVMLGEVDCGFTIWYYADNYNIPVLKQLNRSLKSYESFLKNDVYKYFKNNKVILLGSVLPTINDQTNKKFLSGARSKIKTSLIERTQLTIKYNLLLKDMARKSNSKFVSISDEILDKNTMTVASKYLNDDPFDHHLNLETSSVLWVKKLKEQLNV